MARFVIPPLMSSLRASTVASLLALFALLALAQSGLVSGAYNANVEQTERRDELLRARQAQALLQASLEDLKRQSWDSANWDEAYAYVEGRNPRFLESNFSPNSYNTRTLDVIAVLTSDLQILNVRSFDHPHGQLQPVDSVIPQSLGPHHPVEQLLSLHEPRSGFLQIGSQIFMAAAAPITLDAEKGNPVGWFIALRRVDQSYLDYLSDLIGSQVNIHTAPLRTRSGLIPLTQLNESDMQLEFLSDRQLASHHAVGKTDDENVVVMTMRSSRTLYLAAKTNARNLVFLTLLVGALTACIAVYFISHRLLSPLNRITKALSRISGPGDFSERLDQPLREDEFGSLTHSVNDMLARIEDHEKQLQISRDAAVSASLLKSEFVARMSHEIRTPMNGVLGMTELLQRTHLDSRQAKFCDTIYRSAKSLLTIVNDILDFSKMEAGRLLLQPTRMSLQEITDGVVDQLAARAHDNGTEIIVDIDDGVPGCVLCDPDRLGQVLTNLVGNAVKFTQNGEIVVRVTSQPADEGFLSLLFEVSDTGIGISRQACATIFESFSQGDNDPSITIKGTGLGLAIAKQLIELMGGSIAVRSELGRGSVFSFNVLASATPEATLGQPNTLSLYGQRVLVADNSKAAGAALARHLTRLGASVMLVTDAESLLSRLSGPQISFYDLLIVDQDLFVTPVKHQLEGLRLAEQGACPRVMLLSTLPALVGDSISVLEPVDMTLPKPVSYRALTECVPRVLSLRVVPSIDPSATGIFETPRRSLGLRVLVVEDNAVNREVVLRMLEILNCSVEVATNGDEALGLLEQSVFDLILMDQQMPVRDGLSTTRLWRLREMALKRSPIPILGLTANVLPGARAACLAAGMDDLLLKPFAFDDLSRRLARIARRRGDSRITQILSSSTIPQARLG